MLRDAPIAQVYLMTLQSNMQIWPHIKSRKELGSREMIYDEVKYGDAGKKGNGRGDNKSAEDERNVNYVKAMILKARKVAGEEK